MSLQIHLRTSTRIESPFEDPNFKHTLPEIGHIVRTRQQNAYMSQNEATRRHFYHLMADSMVVDWSKNIFYFWNREKKDKWGNMKKGRITRFLNLISHYGPTN